MPTEAFARAAGGVRLRYAIHGGGPFRFALTHSLAMDRHFWEPVIAALGADATTLSWDCRGHGQSDKPTGPYTAEQFANDLAAVMDDAGWDSAVAAGASMGGCVTLAFGIHHPDRVTGLGLIDTTASYGPTAPEDWEKRAAKAKTDGLASMTDFQRTRWFSDDFGERHPEVLKASIATFCANDVDAYGEACRMLGRVDLTARLGDVRVPTLVIVGEQDYATPIAMAQTMHRGIAGSTLEVIAGARHFTPLECPQLIASRLRALAEKTQP